MGGNSAPPALGRAYERQPARNGGSARLTGALLGDHDETTVRGFFTDLVSQVLFADAEIAEAAARLRSRAPLRMPDALVLATAGSRPEVTTLLTGDRDVARVRDAGVRVNLLASEQS